MFLARHLWEEYGAWHLALAEGVNDSTTARYAFLDGDFRRMHRTGLITCHYHTAEWGHKSVEPLPTTSYNCSTRRGPDRGQDSGTR